MRRSGCSIAKPASTKLDDGPAIASLTVILVLTRTLFMRGNSGRRRRGDRGGWDIVRVTTRKCRTAHASLHCQSGEPDAGFMIIKKPNGGGGLGCLSHLRAEAYAGWAKCHLPARASAIYIPFDWRPGEACIPLVARARRGRARNRHFVADASRKRIPSIAAPAAAGARTRAPTV